HAARRQDGRRAVNQELTADVEERAPTAGQRIEPDGQQAVRAHARRGALVGHVALQRRRRRVAVEQLITENTTGAIEDRPACNEDPRCVGGSGSSGDRHAASPDDGSWSREWNQPADNRPHAANLERPNAAGFYTADRCARRRPFSSSCCWRPRTPGRWPRRPGGCRSTTMPTPN